MHPQKLSNILALSTEDRYWYSIREIVKHELIWAISTVDSWVTFVDKSQDEIFPIWPHKEAAEACAFDELKLTGYSVASISLDKFLEYCIPDMKQSEVLFGVFYNQGREGLVIDATQLKLDLTDEM